MTYQEVCRAAQENPEVKFKCPELLDRFGRGNCPADAAYIQLREGRFQVWIWWAGKFVDFPLGWEQPWMWKGWWEE
jgi:hypothetical protein